MAGQRVPITMSEVLTLTSSPELERKMSALRVTLRGYKGTSQRFVHSIAASASVWRAKNCSLQTHLKRLLGRPEQPILKRMAAFCYATSLGRRSLASMRIDGQGLWCDEGIMRPVMSGEILAGNGSWEKSEFLVDTGADRTVFSAATLAKLGLQPLLI
jgi:hypothetical protein